MWLIRICSVMNGNKSSKRIRQPLEGCEPFKYEAPTVSRESALTYSRFPPLRTGTRDCGPENGHRWARPICRPRRYLRVTGDCGSSIANGSGRRKAGGLAVVEWCGWADVGERKRSRRVAGWAGGKE